MSPIPIPERSLQRLRAAYATFEQLSQVVMEAMGIDPTTIQSFDLQGGVLVPFEPDHAASAPANGVVQEVT